MDLYIYIYIYVSPDEVLFRHVDEVDPRLGREQVVLVEQVHLLEVPLAEAHVLLLLGQPGVDLDRHVEPVLLLLGLAVARHLTTQHRYIDICIYTYIYTYMYIYIYLYIYPGVSLSAPGDAEVDINIYICI